MQADTLPRSESVSEPAHKWRNWWHTKNGISTQRNGQVGPDQAFPGSMTFWSRAEAEAQARTHMARDVFYVLSEGVTYLGAYPEGERPHGGNS